MAERQLGDEIIVLEGLRGVNIKGDPNLYSALVNFPHTGINESALAEGGEIEREADIVTYYRYQPDLIVNKLINKSRQLKKIAADRFKVSKKAQKALENNYKLAERLGRVGVSLVQKKQTAGLPRIKRRFLEASGRTIGYARLEALSSLLAGSAATQSVLLEAATYALRANRRAHANRYLAERHKIGHKTREIITAREKYKGAAVIPAVQIVNKGGELGNIFEDFINLFKEIIGAIKDAIDDITREFQKLSCELCDVLGDGSFRDSAKVAAMVVGGPEASAGIEKAISEAGKYLQCEGCIALIKEKQAEAEELRVKIQQRALEIIGLQIQWNPNIVLFKRQLVDSVRTSIQNILVREYSFNRADSAEIAAKLITIDNLRDWEEQWLRLHPEDRVKINNTPFVTGAFSQDEWATIYGVALKTWPGFENLGYQEKWWRLRHLADKWNCETTGNKWGSNPNPRFPGQGQCSFTSDHNESLWVENYRYYRDIVGVYDYSSQNNINRVEKWWTDRVPEDFGRIQIAKDAQTQVVVNAQYVTEFLKALNRALGENINLLEKSPDSKPYADQVNKIIIALKGGLPNIEALVAQVRPYNTTVASFLSNEIIIAKNLISKGTGLVLIYIARQIKNERDRLKSYADSQIRVAVQMAIETALFIEEIKKSPEQSKIAALEKLRPNLSHQREILIAIRTEAERMKEYGVVNQINAALNSLNGVLIASGQVIYKNKQGIQIKPTQVAVAAVAAAAPFLLLLL